MQQTLAFIGGGNMARSLIGGLIARGAPAQNIIVADPFAPQLDGLRADYQVRTTSDNAAAAQEAEVIVLAVKPQELRNVTFGMRAALERRRPLLISVAAGIRGSDIQRWSGGLGVVRCMPNRPALYGLGVTALFATSDVPAPARSTAEGILGAVGKTLWLDKESDMDAVTAVSGSGPAYFFLLIEMLEQAGIELGLSAEVSRTLAAETAYGASVMAREGAAATTLREQVTSRGGTTEAALRHLEAHGIREMFTAAVAAAAERSRQLAEEFGRG